MLKHCLLLLAITCVGEAAASTISLLSGRDDMKLVGQAKMEYLWWDVYRAELYAPHGIYVAAEPFALSLHYLMSLSGEDIAKRSVKEMKRIGATDEVQLQTWERWMMETFPDVDEGTTLTGYVANSGAVTFFNGDEYLGEIADPLFARYFFGIWLDDNTSEPKLREKLLGSGQ